MRFAFLAQRLCNTPLLLLPGKAEIVMAALADRLGIMRLDHLPSPEAAWGLNENRPARSGYALVGSIAVIPVTGTLVQKSGSLQPECGMTGYDGIRQNFLMALSDPEVKAIMLDIDSPGGEVSGCFDLAQLIYEARGIKPIWSVLSECAYSAAYALASAADIITVPQTGGTGSIGVIWMHVDWSQAIKNNGLNVTFITHGARKTDGHPEIPLSPEAKEKFQADINAVGELFITTVARNRNLSAEKISAMEAATFRGAESVANGLADAMMPPDAAFRALLEKLA